jgi:hypothetical protein
LHNLINTFGDFFNFKECSYGIGKIRQAGRKD